MGSRAHTHLVTLGRLFILAALAQIVWPVIHWLHWDAAVKYINPLPLGWIIWLVWYSFFLLIPLQIIIGIRIIWVGRHTSAKIEQTTRQERNVQFTCLLLTVGITLDIACLSIIWMVKHEGVLIFIFMVMGARALWTNLETAKRYWFG